MKTSHEQHLTRAEAATERQQTDVLLAVAVDLLPHWHNLPEGRKFYDLMRADGYVSAALVLQRQLLPLRHVAVGTEANGIGWSASVGEEWMGRAYGSGATPALAIVAAVLRGLIAQREDAA